MDYIIEIICELFLSVILSVIDDRKISKWIRYPLTCIITVLYTFTIGVLIWAGIVSLKNDIVKSVMFFGLSTILLFSGIMSIRRICEKKDNF
ncbi:hypothetical protein ACTQYZ_01700 [Anaerofustis sp. LCP19S3_F7]|uniref:hypothetical protein n=1 Tax=Anaerofustis sp. LCP19S3_F7 TaxID=3440247 RepID=UPI003F930BDD